MPPTLTISAVRIVFLFADNGLARRKMSIFSCGEHAECSAVRAGATFENHDQPRKGAEEASADPSKD